MIEVVVLGIFEKIFGTYSSREIKRIMPLVKQINDLEEKVEKQQTQISKQQTEIDDLKRIVNTFKPLICSQVGCNTRQSDIIGLISDDSFDSKKGA